VKLYVQVSIPKCKAFKNLSILTVISQAKGSLQDMTAGETSQNKRMLPHKGHSDTVFRSSVDRGGQFEEEDGEEEREAGIGMPMAHTIPGRIGDYEIRGTVGEGSFSVVRLAYHLVTRKFFACKIVEKERIQRANFQERFELEIRIHQQLHHPGIIALCDLLTDDNFYYVILEFCPGGELFQYIVDRGNLPEDAARLLLGQLLLAVDHIHKVNVAHRDLKPENLLLDHLGHIKVSDFGLSRFLDQNGRAQTPCGSPCYASPECVSGRPYDGAKSDIWSLGVVFYAMVTGQLPWTKRNQKQLFEQIRLGDFQIPTYLSDPCRSMIRGLMCVRPSKRLSAQEALEHEFLRGVTEEVDPVRQPVGMVSLKRVDHFFGIDRNWPDLDYVTEPVKRSEHCFKIGQIKEEIHRSKRGNISNRPNAMG
jgi:serine/threonine protein kinase